MIIFRYLAREVLTNMLAVSLILLAIIISARFATYLAEAAAGKLDAGILLTLMAFRLMGYMELILPLGLFIGILLAYGRMYVDSEMTVLSACGMSERRLVVYTLFSSAVVASLVGFLSLYVGPQGIMASEKLLAEQRNRTDFETLKPARFHDLDSGNGVIYAESISDDKRRLRQVFMAELGLSQADGQLTVLTAESGETAIDPVSGHKYLLLKNGRRYFGRPGDVNYRIVDFAYFSQQLPEPDYDIKSKKATDAMSTTALLAASTPEARAALQWRLSLPLLVMIVGLMAVPLSRTQPRRGRYVKMLPAILIYIIYLVSVNAARGNMEKGDQAVAGLLWWVHFAFFLLALALLAGDKLLPRKRWWLVLTGEGR